MVLALYYIPLQLIYIFIHSSVDGQLGSIHILVIVNNAAINIEVHIAFKLSVFVFFQIYTQEWNCCLIQQIYCSFLRNLHIVLHSSSPIYIPTNTVRGFYFPHIFSNICYLGINMIIIEQMLKLIKLNAREVD